MGKKELEKETEVQSTNTYFLTPRKIAKVKLTKKYKLSILYKPKYLYQKADKTIILQSAWPILMPY